MCRIEKKPTHYQIVPVNSNFKKKSSITQIYRATSKNKTSCGRYTKWLRGAEPKGSMHPSLAGSACQFYRPSRVSCLVLEMHFHIFPLFMDKMTSSYLQSFPLPEINRYSCTSFLHSVLTGRSDLSDPWNGVY